MGICTTLILQFLILWIGRPSAFAAIVGENNLISYPQLEARSIQRWAEATATQIDLTSLKPADGHSSFYPAGQLNGFCPSDPLAMQKTLGGCSGFMVDSTTLVTAGHCRDYSKGCGEDAWVFRHFSQKTEGESFQISNQNIYRCVEVLDFKHEGGADYAVLRLERAVETMTPFSLNLRDDVETDDPLAVLGYPLGLPFTFTPGGSVFKISSTHLESQNLDVFSNNSGSVVINFRTGLAEGILTNGPSGISINSLDGCRESVHVPYAPTKINRLQQIPYLRDRFAFQSKLKTYKIVNNCGDTVDVIAKFASPKNNAFVTKTSALKPSQVLSLETKYTPIYVFAETQSGQTLIKGRDFYGFKASSRQEEYGFLKMEEAEIALCPSPK